MKCDLHVHSIHSGMCTVPLLRRICRESYSDPEEVYAALKEKGMGLVTLTDHDSIGSAEILRRHPDFFVSEEATCRMPSGTVVHVGVYDISDRQHIEIQRRKDDLASLLAYLTERRLLFSINHVFSSLTGKREIDDFSWFARYFPAFETRSGQMLPYHNRQAERLARRLCKVGLAGSDAHALVSVGNAYTDVPQARNKAEFLQGLRDGAAVLTGTSGSYFRLTRDVLLIAARMAEEKRWTLFLSPLALLVPVATLATLIDEMIFARRWAFRVDEQTSEFMQAAEVFAWP